VTSRPAAAQRLCDLAALRRVRDRIDREHAQPLNVEALLRAGDLSVTEVCFAVGCGSLGSFSSRFTELVGVAPQTDESYYVGFEAAGQQIGLVPGGGPQGMTAPVAYWHVPDLEAKLAEVTAAGAAVKEPAHDVGGRRLVARRL
jgi:hypothetical protein